MKKKGGGLADRYNRYKNTMSAFSIKKTSRTDETANKIVYTIDKKPLNADIYQ